MPLLPIRVIGPLSECSHSIRVEGQLTGAQVEIFMTGHAGSIGGGVATWADETFALNAGIALAPGASVQASQSLGPDVSALGPGVTVQKKPPQIGPVAFLSHIYQCGQCVWISGAVPGATVEVKAGASHRGSGTADDGNARFDLGPATGAGEVLNAQQTACGTPGVVTVAPPADAPPVGKNRQLPPPTIPATLKQCERAIPVSGVLEGATVTIHRTAGPTEAAHFDVPSLWFILSTPLVLGETVTADQSFPACEIHSSPSAAATVVSAIPVPPPTVVGPLCAGGTVVTLSGLLPGAQVKILQSGVELGTAEAPDASSFDFPVPALTGGTVVTARQALCANWSVDSTGVPVDVAPHAMPTPIIPGPLFQCAGVVRVTSLHPGARVFVFSTLLGAEIGEIQAFAAEVDVPVAPLLILGDKIFAQQIGCGKTSHRSATQTVQHAPKLTPPQIRPPLNDCMTSVPVTNVIPGALVDVFVNGVWKGTAAAGSSSITVGVNGRLKVGDLVTARQRLCTMISGFGRTVRVIHSQDRNWPMLHHDAQHTGLATCSDITSSTVGNLMLVTDPVHLEGSVLSVPSIVDGKIYVGTSTPGGGTMYRIDLVSGAIEHQFSFTTLAGQLSEQGEGGIGCSPAVIGGRVYFSCLDGKVRCLDASTFQLIWAVDLRNADPAHNQPVTNLGAADARAEGWSSPLVINNRVYVGFGEGEGDPAAFGFVYCLDANLGNVIWLFCTNQFVAGVDNMPNVVPSSTVGGAVPAGYNGFNIQADPPSRGASVWSSCAYHAGLNRIFVGTGNGNPDMPLPNPGYSSGILSLDATTGVFQGFFQMAPNDSYRLNDLDTDVPCAPMLFRRGAQDVVTFGGKNGAAFLLDPANLNVLARRQLLPKDGAGNPLPNVDPHGGEGENLWGIFGSPAIDPAIGHVYFGLGGYEGIDGATTPFLRACDWNNLADAWPTAVGPDGVSRYTTPTPWMYATSEAGISSPAVVNDVVFVSTSKGYADPSDPALYAFASSNGTPLWKASGFPTGDSFFAVGPAISGNFVVIGAGSDLMIYRL